jgi:hypothetical protein
MKNARKIQARTTKKKDQFVSDVRLPYFCLMFNCPAVFGCSALRSRISWTPSLPVPLIRSVRFALISCAPQRVFAHDITVHSASAINSIVLKVSYNHFHAAGPRVDLKTDLLQSLSATLSRKLTAHKQTARISGGLKAAITLRSTVCGAIVKATNLFHDEFSGALCF